jgi:uncharacterized protein (DUF58 family)
VLSAEDLKQIKRLHLQLGKEADSHFVGEYRASFRGQGMEFEDVRQYVPGDDVRRIDWNVTARTGLPHVKEFREEREMSILLAVDVSASMNFGSKKRLCAQLAGAIAFAAMRNQDRIGLILFGQKVHKVLPPQKKNGYAWRIIREVFTCNQNDKGTLFSPMVDVVKRVAHRKSVVCVLSDFISSDWRTVTRLTCRHRLHALMIHDQLENMLPSIGLLDVEDSESGQTRLVDCNAMQRISVEKRKKILQDNGIRCGAFSHEEDVISGLLQHFRSENGR